MTTIAEIEAEMLKRGYVLAPSDSFIDDVVYFKNGFGIWAEVRFAEQLTISLLFTYGFIKLSTDPFDFYHNKFKTLYEQKLIEAIAKLKEQDRYAPDPELGW